MRLYAFLLLLVFFIAGCKKDRVSKDRQDDLTDWLRMRDGSRWIYKVDSIAYRRDKPLPDTFSFELMEMIDTFFQDNVDEQVAGIKVVSRRDSLDFWQFRRMYYVKITADFYERVEENIRYLKMSFPPAEEAVWNLNSRNNLPASWLFYQDLYKPYTGNANPVDSTLTIVSKEIDNNIEKFRYREIYGKGVGLIYRENVEMLNQGVNWDGYKRIQKLVYAD